MRSTKGRGSKKKFDCVDGNLEAIVLKQYFSLEILQTYFDYNLKILKDVEKKQM